MENSQPTEKLPPGIRKTPPLKDGSSHFEARVNRLGVEMSKRFATVDLAVAWKTRMDAVIETGIDPRSLAKSNPGGLAVLTNTPVTPPAPGRPLPDIPDVVPKAPVDMTVAQAINGYLAYRRTHHIKLPPNQITEYERVRDDMGSLIVSNLLNQDIANYISVLLSTSRKRDDPTIRKVRKTSHPPEANLSAKARANARYKAKIKAARPPRKPKPLAGATVRKYIVAMQTALEWQAKNRRVTYDLFLFDFDSRTLPPAWGGQRDRRLVPGEEGKLYAAGIDRGGYTYTQQDWRALLGFALETALRQQELAFAKFADQREGGRKLFVPKANSKTKKDRYILLSSRARDIIDAQLSTSPKGGTRIFHQFPNPQAMCDSYKRLTERAGIDNLTFHDLRHEATSRLCEGGQLSTMEIMEMTGHDTMTTFKGYVNLIAPINGRSLN